MSGMHPDAEKKPLLAAWRRIVHHVIHPVSGAIVLAAAGVEAFEWLVVAYDHLGHLMDAMLRRAGG